MRIAKVYGPYIRKQDNRQVVILKLRDGKLTTQTYAKFLFERQNGKIEGDLTVDHIDEDVSNDALDNFQLLTRSENIRKSQQSVMFNGVCPVCDMSFTKLMRNVRGNWKKGKEGPFCSRTCAGYFNAAFQYRR